MLLIAVPPHLCRCPLSKQGTGIGLDWNSLNPCRQRCCRRKEEFLTARERYLAQQAALSRASLVQQAATVEGGTAATPQLGTLIALLRPAARMGGASKPSPHD
uniref:Uncharacterized protein n=1 Tax=Odontella aurita TaxID=265563 RepID=A0A7S4JZ40_9STRA